MQSKRYGHPIISTRLYELWLDSELTQTELGQRVGVDRKTVNSYLNGASIPNAEILRKLCIEFNVSADYILGLEA